ncbi:MAG TPA: energy transducer TonB [Blastocatellia bacterium]|nr:energy transducer TonB [Blastocatellia bacterium]
MYNDALFVSTLNQPCVITRMRDELKEACREFREDPLLFITCALRGDAGGRHRKSLLRSGLAVGLSFYAVAFLCVLILSSLAHHPPVAVDKERGTLICWSPHSPKAEMPEDDNQAGGGGGGRKKEQPPSAGEVPEFSMKPIVTPRPEQQLNLPNLPVIEALMGDPRIQVKHDDLGVTGLPDGVNGPPSPGPGLDGGIGTGGQGGIGPCEGPGYGLGHGGNTNGGEFHIAGTPKREASQPVVDTRPILLNEPRPLYTEEARKNKVQGVVRVRVLVDERGTVREVRITRGLPDGLNEQAVRAAYQMRFAPAMKNGRPVSYWLSNVEIEFNLR